MAGNALQWELLTKAAEHIGPDDFGDYFELKRLLAGKDAKDRRAFRELFTSYYRLRIGGLTEAFKDRFFELLSACDPVGQSDPYTPLLLNLYGFHRRKGDQTIQASFVSKLVSIHDESRPIFDRHVSNFFGISVPKVGTKEFRIAGFVANMERIQEEYETWQADSRFDGIKRTLYRKQKKLQACHPTRLCDFLVWTIGARRLT